MQTYLDDRPYSAANLPPNARIAELLDAARGDLAGTGRMIVGLRLNRESVPADRIEEILTRPLDHDGRLDLLSDHPKAIILQALQQSRDAFSETFAYCREAADALAAARSTEAMEILMDCVTIWSQTHECIVQGGSLLDVNFAEVTICHRPIVDALNELAGRLRDIKDAIQSHDYVVLGDILRYELDETLRSWENLIGGFIKYIEQLPDE